MNDFYKLCDDIRSSMSLSSASGTGFHSCYCPVCNKTEKQTAGLKFEDNQVIFNCFRASCDATCVYTYGEPVSKKFRRFVDTIGVKIPPSLSMVKSSFQKKMAEELDDDLYKKHFYKDMKIPKKWVPLAETNNQKLIKQYEDRCCPIDDVYYVKSGLHQGATAIAMKWFDKVIGFQISNPSSTIKYQTISDNTHLMMINGGVLSDTVVVVEGILDALCFPGACGVLRSEITPEQAFHLRHKRVILLPDRSGNSFIEQAFEYGWEVCIPEWKCKDLNAAVQQYGKLSVAKMIRDNVYSNKLEITARYRLWVQEKHN